MWCVYYFGNNDKIKTAISRRFSQQLCLNTSLQNAKKVLLNLNEALERYSI